MQIRNIRLVNFRNYEQLKLQPQAQTNVFVGNNAQGKTNLLEAIYMFSCVKSHRSPYERDLVFKEKSNFLIDLDYVYDDGVCENLKIAWSKNTDGITNSKGRKLFVNDLAVDKLSEFIGRFHAVIFAPEDTTLIKDAPKDRRHFLDMMISQTDSVFLRSMQTYVKLLQHKNTLLKTLREKTYGYENDDLGVSQVDIWDHELCQCGAEIVLRRNEAVLLLNEIARQKLFGLTDNKEKLTLCLQSHGIVGDENSKTAIAKRLYEKMLKSRKDDIMRGTTSVGPHRDDLIFYLNDEEIKAYASQGQHRSVILALKLAEMAFIEVKTSQKPVLLLDDVMSELDESRRTALIDAFADYQVFITCTDKSQIVSSKEATKIENLCFFEVEGASIKTPV